MSGCGDHAGRSLTGTRPLAANRLGPRRWLFQGQERLQVCPENRLSCLLERFVEGRHTRIQIHHVSIAMLIEGLQGIVWNPAADTKNKERTERNRRGYADMVILKRRLQDPRVKAYGILRWCH